MWKDFIQDLNPEYQFSSGCSEADIRKSEKELGFALPDDLKSLLRESNGVTGKYKLPLVWTIDRIVESNREFRKNKEFRNLYMPFDCMLFFADAGNGDQFAFPMNGNVVIKDEVYVWNHEDDSREWISVSLKSFIRDWDSGKIKV